MDCAIHAFSRLARNFQVKSTAHLTAFRRPFGRRMLIYFFSVELNQLCDAEAEEERIVPENQEDGDSSNDIAPDAAASGESTEDQANNPQDKNDIHPSIRKIIDKKIDFTGNTVTNILVVGDE